MLGQTGQNKTSFIAMNERRIPSADTGMGQTACLGLTHSRRWLRRSLLALVVVVGAGMASEPVAAKKAPPIAQPMYLEAYTNMVFRKSSKAIKPLTHLVAADPNLPDLQNALALALFISEPDQLDQAHVYASRAAEMAPKVPQFIVTKVLTDSSLWKIESDGTARLTREAAAILSKVAEELLDMSGNAKKLGKILGSIEESGGDADFPFIFVKYKKFLKKPSLALTRPSEKEFDVAQKALIDKIINLRKKLNEDNQLAQDESRKAEERKTDIANQVAEAAERQRKVEEAQARAIEKLQLAALDSALSAKNVAELKRQRQLAAEVEQRRIE